MLQTWKLQSCHWETFCRPRDTITDGNYVTDVVLRNQGVLGAGQQASREDKERERDRHGVRDIFCAVSAHTYFDIRIARVLLTGDATYIIIATREEVFENRKAQVEVVQLS